MYIRRTQIQKKKEGGFYYTYRIVESMRTGKQVRQYTLLNLGADFFLAKEKWPILTKRILITHETQPYFQGAHSVIPQAC